MRLCYIEDDWAYFTSQPLDDQWGDDWDDVPYEHNASTPYPPCWHNLPDYRLARGGDLCTCDTCKKEWNEDGTPKWSILKVAFEGPFRQPNYGHSNSPYSVRDINSGAVAWLATERHIHKTIIIPAGTTLEEFIEKVHLAGGKVYVEYEPR